MRRGHSNIGGWRNENSRHFGPRNGGPPQFRANRNYILHDAPRFPPPPHQHSYREPQFDNRPVLLNNPPTDHHDRNKYRNDNRQKSPYKAHHNQRSVFPVHDHIGPGTLNDNKRYTSDEHFHINSMGDVDHRKPMQNYAKRQEPYNRRPTSQWSNPLDDNNKYYYEDRNSYKSYKHHENVDSNKIPTVEYSGHRPPASDHYGGNPSTTLDNSNTFSRSVDDTVDFIRKRLQNRGELNQSSEEQRSDNSATEDHLTEPMSSSYQNIQQSQPVKKRMQRQSLNVEANCDKMKNKIVHQLFKMDKVKIHKLMDNPSSSSKFEYALSSLITESQNSLNRHLRSVAEKSLCSSEAFVHNDNNTIYEDTFMKQMQGILDPQDTVLLEDIKPLVLAELSKVLQLNEYDQPFQLLEDHGNSQAVTDQEAYDNDYENYSQNDNYYEQIQSPQTGFEDLDNPGIESNDYTQEVEETKPLFERRPAKHSVASNIERKLSSESQRRLRMSADTNPSVEDSVCNERRYSRRSLDKPSEDIEQPPPLFDTKAEQFSDDEDPFAELDKQYHVAVEPNFIDTYDISSPQQQSAATSNLNTTIERNDKLPADYQASDTGKEIDSQFLNIPKPSLKLAASNCSNNKKTEKSNSFSKVKQEIHSVLYTDEHKLDANHESILVSSSFNDLTSKSVNTPAKTTLSNSRKRSVDQNPSHRKEKRKKSDSIQPEPVKDAVLDVFDSPAKHISQETVKTFSNSSVIKNNSSKEIPKDTKNVVSGDKYYSEKYVKRKETQNKKENKAGQKTRQRSTSSSRSIVSPKDNSNNNNKVEPKNKLQTIDMFIELPKKVNVHQAHRNTAQPPTPTPTPKVVEVAKPPIASPFNRKIVKKHVSTQVTRKCNVKETQTLDGRSFSSRFCQTIKKKTVNVSVQTDTVYFERSGAKASDAFERMKEIDMEIQVLLQEKFKLYNSLESNEPCQSTMQTLGMTVLNVASPDPKDSEDTEIDALTEDAIVEGFTNIPVEELEQIALETLVDHNDEIKLDKKSRRQKILIQERASSSSPTTRSKLKAKPPNISLIEQIISDDRPLEDIISLDALETTPTKNKRHKPQKLQSIPKKKATKKAKAVKTTQSPLIVLKDCSVVLTRQDLSKYFVKVPEESQIEAERFEVFEIAESTQVPNIVEDTTASHLQFDMLDVSEDIVVGDNCEIKSSEDKDAERTEITLSEEVILDNSQSLEPQHSDMSQGENICKMYDYSNDDNLRRDSITVSGHADAVLAIESVENNFIAACLDGNVYYFNGEGQLLSTLRGSNLAVTCLTIVKEKNGTTVYTGSLDSRIRYYDLETGLEKGPECNVLSPIQTMDRAWDTIFVGTRTGFVLQFECKNNMLIPVSTVKFSDQSILALRAMKEGPRKVLLVAARSEDVTIKDAQTGLLLRTLQGPKMTVYSLLYEDGKIYCGTSSHQIHVFDYASGTHVGVHEGGKGAVCLRATGGLVLAGCYDGCVYVYREGEPRPLAQLRGPSLMLLSLAVVGSKIIAGYKDRSLYIWKIPLSILQEMIL